MKPWPRLRARVWVTCSTSSARSLSGFRRSAGFTLSPCWQRDREESGKPRRVVADRWKREDVERKMKYLNR